MTPLNEITGNQSNPEFPNIIQSKHEKLKFGKRKSQFLAINRGGESEDITEDICLKQANKLKDVIVLT